MTLQKSELVQHYRDMHARLLAALDGLTEAEQAEPSIDGWSVANHLSHLALWDDIRAEEVERISAGFESAWRMDGPQSDCFSPVMAELRSGLGVAQCHWELERSHARFLAALEEATPRGLDPELYGEAGLLSHHKEEHTGWIERWRQFR